MKRLVAFAALLLPLFASAHEGHGTTDGYSIIHYFGEPLHIASLGVVLVLSILLFVRKRRRTRGKKM